MSSAKSYGVLKLLVRSVSGVAVVKILGAGLSFLSHVVLARVLTISGYGKYVYAWTWVVVVSVLCRAGFDNLLVRYGAKLLTENNWNDLGDLFRQAVQYVAALTGAVALISYGTLLLVGARVTPNIRTTLVALSVLLPLLSMLYLARQTLRGLKKVIRANIPDLIIRPFLLVLLCILAYLAYGNIDGIDAVLLAALSVTVAVGISMVWIYHDIPTLKVLKSKEKGKNWGKIALPFLVISGMGLIQRKTDIIMVGMFLESGKVGVYGAALRLTTLVGFGASIVNMTVSPYFSQLYTESDREGLQRLVTLSAIGASLSSLLVAGTFLILGETLLSFFGEEYLVGFNVMVVLAIGKAASTIIGQASWVMMMTDQERSASIVEGALAVCNVVLNFILIPRYGLIGAATATFISMVSKNAILTYFAYKIHRINATMFTWRSSEFIRSLPIKKYLKRNE